MTLYDETQDFKSIIGADSEDTVGNPTGVTEETSPKFSKAFLEFIEDTFDIRKSIYYEDSIEKLKGIQEVVGYMRRLYDNNFRLYQ